MAITRSQSAKLGQNNETRNSSNSAATTSGQEEVLASQLMEDDPSNELETVSVEDSDKFGGGTEGLEGLAPQGTNQQRASEIGMPELPCPWNPSQKYLLFPRAKSLGQRDWPQISYGDHAPEPRWRVCPDQKDPLKSANDHTEDLIKKATGKWEIKGVRPKDDPQYNARVHKPPLSYDHTVGLGALRWTFDEGDEKSWNGLSRDQLHEYAFRCLLVTTRNPICGGQIENDILNGQYRDNVKHVASPVPPLPPILKWGISLGSAASTLARSRSEWSIRHGIGASNTRETVWPSALAGRLRSCIR